MIYINPWAHSRSAYQSREELLAKVRHYLEHADQRERIASAGREAVLARHTYAHRMDTILETAFARWRTAARIPECPPPALAPAPRVAEAETSPTRDGLDAIERIQRGQAYLRSRLTV